MALGSATSSLCQDFSGTAVTGLLGFGIWLWKSHLGALNNTLTALENAPPSCFSHAQKFPTIKTFLRRLRKGFFPMSLSPSWKSLSVHLFGFILQKILLQAISASRQSLLCSDSTKWENSHIIPVYQPEPSKRWSCFFEPNCHLFNLSLLF